MLYSHKYWKSQIKKKKSSYGGLKSLKSRSNVEVGWDIFIILFGNGVSNFPLKYIVV